VSLVRTDVSAEIIVDSLSSMILPAQIIEEIRSFEMPIFKEPDGIIFQTVAVFKLISV
jgi:hypothetical protein